MTAKSISAYKAFDENMKCRNHHYEVGETYEHSGSIEMCGSGFHACLSPFDCWDYYDLTSSKFATVELIGKTLKHKDDTKIVAGKITVTAELTLPEFIKAGVDWLIAATKRKNKAGYYAQIGSSGYSAKIGSSGDYAKIGSSGYYAQIGSSGYYAQIGSSGYSAKIGSSGYSAQIGSSGYSAKIGSSGYSAQIGSSGDYTKIGSSGYSAQIGSSGDSAKIDTSGENAVIASSGNHSRAKGIKGTWISIAEYNRDGECVGFATGCIGKKRLKPDTWYFAEDGKLKEWTP